MCGKFTAINISKFDRPSWIYTKEIEIKGHIK